MDMNKVETCAVEEIESTVQQLNELELALVGGGCGDISLG